MKSLLIVTALFFTTGAMAEEVKTSTPAPTAQEQTVLPQGKKSRKKKVEMCGECGKPESACECHDKKDEKKEEKKDK